jgi:hypothetical protein
MEGFCEGYDEPSGFITIGNFYNNCQLVEEGFFVSRIT